MVLLKTKAFWQKIRVGKGKSEGLAGFIFLRIEAEGDSAFN